MYNLEYNYYPGYIKKTIKCTKTYNKDNVGNNEPYNEVLSVSWNVELLLGDTF